MSIREAATTASIADSSASRSSTAAVSSTARASAWVIVATTSASESVGLMSLLTGPFGRLLDLLPLRRPGQREPQVRIAGQPDRPAEPQHRRLGGLALPSQRGDGALRYSGRVGQHRRGHPLLGRTEVRQGAAYPDQHRQRRLRRVEPRCPPVVLTSLDRLSRSAVI